MDFPLLQWSADEAIIISVFIAAMDVIWFDLYVIDYTDYTEPIICVTDSECKVHARKSIAVRSFLLLFS